MATCLSTLYVGSGASSSARTGGTGLLYGLRYAVPVMTILLCHEMGHFIQAHRYGVYASLPYFIPMPFSPFGTFGAVIAMEPRVGGRRALFDIGISGPLAGLVPTFIFLIIGLQHSTYAIPPRQATAVRRSAACFGFLADWILGPMPKGYEIITDPMAFAGWVGLFITSLNLIPIGQLDGGHVLYALLRRKAHKVAKFLLFAALFLVIWKWEHRQLDADAHPAVHDGADPSAHRRRRGTAGHRPHHPRLADPGVYLRRLHAHADYSAALTVPSPLGEG